DILRERLRQMFVPQHDAVTAGRLAITPNGCDLADLIRPKSLHDLDHRFQFGSFLVSTAHNHAAHVDVVEPRRRDLFSIATKVAISLALHKLWLSVCDNGNVSLHGCLTFCVAASSIASATSVSLSFTASAISSSALATFRIASARPSNDP